MTPCGWPCRPIPALVRRPPTDGEPKPNCARRKVRCCRKYALRLRPARKSSTTLPHRFHSAPRPTLNNGQWVAGAKGSIFIRQLLFDGFTSLHEVWRQTARVDAAAARTHERSELTALDASEAYIDVVRYTRLVALAQENVAAHRRILSNVDSRFRGGRAGQGDLEQTRERVDAAEVVLTEFRRSLEDARAKFRKVIGIEPYNLRGPATTFRAAEHKRPRAGGDAYRQSDHQGCSGRL